MDLWEDELLGDDFSDEEEGTEEQIEETGLETAAGGFAEWEDASDAAPENESREEALAEERTLELESELEQDEHPRDYDAELEDEEEEAAPTSENGSSGKFAQRLCGGWRKQPGRNRIF